MKTTFLQQTLLAGITLISSSYACFADAPQNQCDIEAASPIDPQRKAAGIDFNSIQPSTAVSACEVANKQFPNDVRLQFQLGRAYQAAKRNSDALVWYERAARSGYSSAQNALGFAYYLGLGVDKSYSNSFFWYQKAADQNDATAQDFLGNLYELGQGVTQDYAKAFFWYQKAADQGNAHAQNFLGNLYQNGQGVTQDYAKAFFWYQKAADQGFSLGQLNLGNMYFSGRGVTKDKDKAISLFKSAAAKGNENAKKVLEIVQSSSSKAGLWTDYSRRKKTLLEEVLNYTTTALEEGNEGDFWVSGVNGQHKCVLSRVGFSAVADVVDIRQLNPQGFRISNIDQYNSLTVGDERTKIRASFLLFGVKPVMERLQNAWGLAFEECPSEVRRKF